MTRTGWGGERPLRFCMLTTFYPPYSFGGDAVGIQRLSRALVRRGHHVTVVHDVDAFNALHRGPEPAAVANDEGVEVVGLRSGMGMLSPLLTQQLGRPVANANRITRLLNEGHYDVVNYHNVSLVGGPGLFRLGRNSVTLYMAHEHWLVCPMHVLWRHGRERCETPECFKCTLHYRRPPQLWRNTGLLERELQHVDAFIAMSEFSRQMHRSRGFSRDMEVLSYFLPDPDSAGMPDATGPSPHGRPYFFFAGRLERIKGLQDVIPVFARYQAADLVIAGDGEYAADLKALAEGMPNVRFIGRVPPDDLSRYYRHAIATIVPSVCYETFGIVLIEAFRQGSPVIARRLGPFPEIVERSGGGELFETTEELVQSMHRLQDNASHRAALARAGYRGYVERWSESAVIPQYLGIVRRAAARSGKRTVLDALPEADVA
ncbi:MAG TPA: glycosyltransferase family 4 protein [Gemmatimonadaceae bacterium]|nr:glycosyltransferase family 4 protein [Gemmatimonadaceae bacterium]